MSKDDRLASLAAQVVCEHLRANHFEVEVMHLDGDEDVQGLRYEFEIFRPGRTADQAWLELDLAQSTAMMRKGEELSTTRELTLADPNLCDRIVDLLENWL